MPSTTITLSSTESGHAAAKITYDKISTNLRGRGIGHTVSESKRYFYTFVTVTVNNLPVQQRVENIEYAWRWDFPSNTSTSPT